MRGCNTHVVFSLKKNFQENHASRQKYVLNFAKNFWFQFYLGFIVFSKIQYALTSVNKNPKI